MSNRKPIAALITAEAFSITGTRLSMIAIPWLVLTTTEDPVLTGVVAFAEMLPYVVVKALSGPVVDRLGARRIAVAGDVLSVPALLLVPLLHLAGVLSVWVILPVVALLGGLRGPADSAKYALVPDLAELGAVPLERVTGLSSAVERFGSTAGAALAGALVVLVGPVNALGVNAAAVTVSAVLLAWGVPRPSPASSTEPTPTYAGDRVAAYVAELREGWTFLRRDAVLVGITTMVALTNLLEQAYAALLVPVWAKETGSGAAAVGLVFAVFSGFSILGALLASAWADRLPRLPVYVVAFVLTGIPRYFVLAFDAPAWLLLSTLAVGGFAAGFINPIIGAVVFERIPKALRGRVSSLSTALCWSLIPFGGLLGGGLVATVGLRAALVSIGVAYLFVTLMPLVRKSFREFGQRPTGPRPEHPVDAPRAPVSA
ncbi:transmembrane secretion effector [Barrientosiimonas humi]|uniref:Transmembrane secretion effector n=1 Tax=Barrientosiimonas humi TaxID=999931 RepID=A0A542X9B2_9MICO|nr:MFS transporter [Barrientosiimonas humi]TQL32418.1 transmembrane secretion effector [Barrientosiimonas humi]CAG7572409.1 putative multidrug-efflux transporter [Barrientosiimonas humi]